MFNLGVSSCRRFTFNPLLMMALETVDGEWEKRAHAQTEGELGHEPEIILGPTTGKRVLE